MLWRPTNFRRTKSKFTAYPIRYLLHRKNSNKGSVTLNRSNFPAINLGFHNVYFRFPGTITWKWINETLVLFMWMLVSWVACLFHSCLSQCRSQDWIGCSIAGFVWILSHVFLSWLPTPTLLCQWLSLREHSLITKIFKIHFKDFGIPLFKNFTLTSIQRDSDTSINQHVSGEGRNITKMVLHNGKSQHTLNMRRNLRCRTRQANQRREVSRLSEHTYV